MTEKMRIKITLLSDMCCGTGEGNGANIDVCTAVNEAGLPIIPAKRIKGLLRKKAAFLADNQVCSMEDVNYIFGGPNGQKSKIKVSDGLIENSDNITQEIKGYFNPKEVTKCFSSTRTQTRINENGIAEKTSLRTIEVVDKGTEFFVDVFLDCDDIEKYSLIVEKSIKLLRSMGLNRTRGFGEVKCDIICKETDDACHGGNIDISKIEYKKSGNVITKEFIITLQNDMVIFANSPVMTQDYITGSMLMGAFAKYTSEYEWFSQLVLKDTVFSNAYITDDELRDYVPAPFSMVQVKNEKDKIYSLSDEYEKDDNKQYVPLNGYIFREKDKLMRRDVVSDLQHHFTTGSDVMEKTLFTYIKIEKGQKFKGTLTADEGGFKVFEEILRNYNNKIYLGASSTAQYGGCTFEFLKQIENGKITLGNASVIEFLSDTIIVDDFGTNTIKPDALIECCKSIVDFSECNTYLKTTVIGGYNAKWKLPKKNYLAFEKGSVLKLTGVNSGRQILEYGQIGLLTNEGYGHYRIRNIEHNTFEDHSDEKTDKADKNAQALNIEDLKMEKINVSEETIARILKNRISEQVALKAINDANKSKIDDLSASAAMRLLTCYQSLVQNNKFSKQCFVRYVEDNFKKNKELADLSGQIVDGFGELKFVDKTSQDEMFSLYLRSFIAQLKRRYQFQKRGV